MPPDNRPSGGFGFLLGGILAIVMAIFLIAGGELGKKQIRGDADMPPISSQEKNFR
jgi:hypothetical protein